MVGRNFPQVSRETALRIWQSARSIRHDGALAFASFSTGRRNVAAAWFHVKRSRTENMAGELPDNAKLVFGEHVERAAEFVRLLTEHGVERGLIGPREVDKIWDRHVLNSAVIEELFEQNERVADVGSGAGLPGVPLAIARPDLRITLLEPMARRIAWLEEVKERLGLDNVTVLRGRAEEGPVRAQLKNCDVVTARAVAPLEKLAKWCLPLLRGGGRMVALKGERAQEELDRDGTAVQRLGGVNGAVVVVGADVLEVPTTVLIVERQTRRDR